MRNNYGIPQAAPPTPDHFAPIPGTDIYVPIKPGYNLANQPTAPTPQRTPSASTGPPIGSMATGEPTSGPGSTPPVGWTQVGPGTWRFTGLPRSPVASGQATPSRQFVMMHLLEMEGMEGMLASNGSSDVGSGSGVGPMSSGLGRFIGIVTPSGPFACTVNSAGQPTFNGMTGWQYMQQGWNNAGYYANPLNPGPWGWAGTIADAIAISGGLAEMTFGFEFEIDPGLFCK